MGSVSLSSCAQTTSILNNSIHHAGCCRCMAVLLTQSLSISIAGSKLLSMRSPKRRQTAAPSILAVLTTKQEAGREVEEATRRKFLQSFPEASTNDEPVLFRSSIIPWWAWIARSHLPKAELLNGSAAMVGFFMAYLVDILTGLDTVGQTGSFICKTAGLLIKVFGVILLRRTKDFENLKKLADEAHSMISSGKLHGKIRK